MVQLQSPWPFIIRHIHTDILRVILHNILEYIFYKVKMCAFVMRATYVTRLSTLLLRHDLLLQRLCTETLVVC